MNKPALHPQYLPSIDRALEYRAGLLPAGAPIGGGQPARQWLGADFTCTIEARPAVPAPAGRR